MVTINRKTRYQLNLNSTRIRFDVEKLTPVSETMVYCASNTQEKIFKSMFFYIPSSEQNSEGKKYNIENNSNELYLSRWNVKNIDLNILA